jgi:Rrf2 family transcriptional regulator, cysteine metabolism repressor
MMIDLARAEPDGIPLSLAEISRRSGVSRRYLEQLAFLLKNAGLIRGVSGRKGGYMLARPADRITVGDVVTASSGQLDFADCIGDPDGCMRMDFCECRPIWVVVNHEVASVLDRYTLEDLVDEHSMQSLRERASALEAGTSTQG